MVNLACSKNTSLENRMTTVQPRTILISSLSQKTPLSSIYTNTIHHACLLIYYQSIN